MKIFFIPLHKESAFVCFSLEVWISYFCHGVTRGDKAIHLLEALLVAGFINIIYLRC